MALQIQEGLSSLTERELEIARLITRGLSNKGIARALKITDGTVKVHLHNVYQKLGIANRTILAMIYHNGKEQK